MSLGLTRDKNPSEIPLKNTDWFVCVLIKITILVEIPSRPGQRELPITYLQRKREFQLGVEESAIWKLYFVGTQSPLRALKTIDSL